MPNPWDETPETQASVMGEVRNQYCTRRITVPGGESANQFRWAPPTSGGPLELQYCPDETLQSCRPIENTQATDTTPKCRDNWMLEGTGLTFADALKPGMVDCKGDVAKSNDLLALACNFYWEGRGEGTMGMHVIGDSTLTRTRSNFDRDIARPVPQCNSVAYPKTVREVVYEQRYDNVAKKCVAQFSWTRERGDKTVRFPAGNPMHNDFRAWREILYVAREHINTIDRSTGRPNNPTTPTGCYSHYLSLHKYRTYDDLMRWARTYIDDSKGWKADKKPVCFGGHILFKNTDSEYKCSSDGYHIGSDRTGDPLGDKGNFMINCLETDPENDLPGKPIPENTLCTGNSVKDIVCSMAQKGYVTDIGGAEVACIDGGGYKKKETAN